MLLLQSYLPELGPLIIGFIAFVIGVGFALRERAWRRKRQLHNRDERYAKTAHAV